MTDTAIPLEVGARTIPVPAHLSPEAQLALTLSLGPATDYPEAHDTAGWREFARAQDDMFQGVLGPQADAFAVHVERRDVAGVGVFVVTPDGIAADDPRVYLEVHGGALVMGGGAVCRTMGILATARTGVRTWAVDYRMPPDHPYPTPLDDCVAVYGALVADRRADHVIVGGGSAGGNLAAATIVRARDEGLPLPAAAVLQTPEVDLTESGDSFNTNLGVDGVLTQRLMRANLVYANGHDLAHPYVSPLFADFSTGFPPTCLTTGTRDLFLSNTVRMHRALRAAGVNAELHVLEAAGHAGFFGFAPEDAEITREIRAFIDRHWGPTT